MAFENLLKSVEESAEEKERELRENAKKQADAIRREAQKLAADLVGRMVHEAEISAEIERNKQLYLANGTLREQALKSREKVFEVAFEAAGQHLFVLRQNKVYPAIFRRLLEETMDAAGAGPAVVHVDPRDLDLCKESLLARKISCEIRTDLTCNGGLTVSSPDGQITLKNTVESRLLRVREHKRREIHAALFG